MKLATKIAVKATTKVATGVAKKTSGFVLKNAVIATAYGVDGFLKGHEKRQTNKLMNKNKKDGHLLISYSQTITATFSNKIKQVKYTVSDEEGLRYNIVRNVESPETVSIYECDAKKPICILRENENTENNDAKRYDVEVEGERLATIIGKNDGSYCKFETPSGESWQIRTDAKKGFIISHLGKTVGKCQKDGLKLLNKSIMCNFNSSEDEDIMLILNVAFMVMNDSLQ